MQEVKKIGYETGIKDQFVQEFDLYSKQYIPQLLGLQSPSSSNKLTKHQFSVGNEKKSDVQIEREIESKFFDVLSGSYFQSESFKKGIIESYQRKKENSMDLLADLVYIKKRDGECLFSERDVEELESEFFSEEYKRSEEMRRYLFEFKYKTYTPELILKEFLNKEQKLTSVIFDGLLTNVWQYKQNPNVSAEDIASKLNSSGSKMKYEVREFGNEKFIVEYTSLGCEPFVKIQEVLFNFEHKVIEQVAEEY